MSTTRPCPVCHSEKTGGYPKTREHTGRGRCDVDEWTCHDCGSRWEIWHYLRDDETENKRIRLKDGRQWGDGEVQGSAIQCRFCKGSDVVFAGEHGHWRNHYDVMQRRYECDVCGGSWVNMTDEGGHVLAWRLWRPRMR